MRFIFAEHINGTLVFSQPEIDGVPHLAGARPSVNFTSATSASLTQVVTASSFTFRVKGDLAVFSLISLP
jgi:hypothetical protein